MRNKIKKRISSQKGNVIVLFAFLLINVIVLLGFSVDIGLMYCKRNNLVEMGNLAREARFDSLPYIAQSTTPDLALKEVVDNFLKENNMPDARCTTEFIETGVYDDGRLRTFKMNIHLEDTYEFKFLKLFGVKEQALTVTVKGGGSIKAQDSKPGVWYPAKG